MKYDYKAVEAKWQKVWEDEKTFHVEIDHKKPKFYALVEFPYPSGAGLHVGHPRSYTALDVVSRKRRQNGYNVLYPMGWDAFGLPTENYAIKNHIHPAIVTKQNIANFTSQLKMLGYGFDWDRCVDTTDPNYYKWTQWIFLQMFKKGLAYKTTMPVNWCTSCKCVLANEEVVNGVCERCGSQVVRRVKSQWMLKITAYAQKLLDGLDNVDFIDRGKVQQRNWIGRSEGAEVDFRIAGKDEKLRVYTTRPDTLFGATYMVISPENAFIKKWVDQGLIKNTDAVAAYQEEAARKSDFERTELNKEKTGVVVEGVKGINPVNGKEIPIFISDYVLATYGTGAIMAVPAHDTRDWEFAKKFGLPIIEVVAGGDVEKEAFTDVATGKLCNSGFLDGLEVVELGIAEAGGQGLEVAVDGILTGGGAGGEGAAVEGVLHRDDDEALGMAVILGVLAGELDLAFVGLGAGVGKEDLIKAAVLDDELRGLDGGLIVEVVGAVEDGLRTLLQALDDGGMAVAETVDGDAADEIEVLVAVLVEDVDALAALHGDGHTDMVAVEILVTVFDDFRIGLELFDHGRVLLLKFYVFFTT